MSSEVRLTITNDGAGGTANPAICTWHAVSPTLVGSALATVCAAFVVGGAPCAANSRITGATYRADGSPSANSVGFDAATWAALEAAYPSLLPTGWTAWGNAFGSGGLAPLGCSVMLSEHTSTPGRSGTGRIHMPWPSSAVINSAGLVSDAARANIEGVYTDVLLNLDPDVGPSTFVVRGSDATALDSPITSVSCSTRFSLLRSRKR